MEVMLEIYRTLKTLKMEWKSKKDPNADLAGADEEDSKKRRRREEENRLKKAQELFFVETRCRMDDVMVRMDLQLYRIDDQNYLVDFRNLGYRPIQPSASISPSASHYESTFTTAGSQTGPSVAVDPGTPTVPMMPNTADEVRLRRPELVTQQSNRKVTGAEVSSPYLFLECAVRLIVELASPAGTESSSG